MDGLRGGGVEGAAGSTQAVHVLMVSSAPKATAIFNYHLGVGLVYLGHGRRSKGQPFLVRRVLAGEKQSTIELAANGKGPRSDDAFRTTPWL